MKSLLQSQKWGEFRQSQGWQADRVDDILVLGRKLFLGKSFLYSPEVDWDDKKNLSIFIENTKKIAEKNKSIFFRLEILDEFDEEIVQKLKKNAFIKAFEEVQPEYRHIIDIGKSKDEILGQMKEKGRYNIRLAQRHDITIEKSNNIAEFYEIFLQTAKRNGFDIRPKEYFEKMLAILSPDGLAELLVARYQNKTVAAEIVSYFGQTASYLYGASSNEDRNLMAPYLLHWETMRRAKERGCKYYDLLAVNPEDNENHKYVGIGRFKRQFGGRTIHLVGSWDLVYQPFWYKIFKIAEQVRRS